VRYVNIYLYILQCYDMINGLVHFISYYLHVTRHITCSSFVCRRFSVPRNYSPCHAPSLIMPKRERERERKEERHVSAIGESLIIWLLKIASRDCLNYTTRYQRNYIIHAESRFLALPRRVSHMRRPTASSDALLALLERADRIRNT